MISTTKEQSARLLKCGVSADTANMSWHGNTLETFPQITYDMWLLTPAWSLSALCELLFKSGHILSMQYERNEYRMQSFYSSGDFVTYGTTAIEACVNMVEKLTTNGYKLNDCPCREKGGEE